MSSDGNFSFSVHVAGLPIPEYTKEGRVYVESNLWTPVSYTQRGRELAYGEVQEQNWPMTPYQVKVVTAPHCTDSWYILYIDGVKVREWVLKGGKEWIFDGFQDADGTREFLFALPRFARDEVLGLPIPEYTKEGRVYVESNLWTPVSYAQRVRELVYGEVEEQDWPVTPYQVKLTTAPHSVESWYFVYIDGVKVGKAILGKGKEWTCKGFEDADGTREFLFALPRFARDENDRVKCDRKLKIGVIEVVRYQATFLHTEYRSSQTGKNTEFEQANKKDAREVTGGSHTMSTTKKGKLVHQARPSSSSQQLKSIWNIGEELGRLSVYYHMAHTLQDMGISVQQMDWSRAQRSHVVKEET